MKGELSRIRNIKKLLRELKIERRERYMLQLSNQLVIVGNEFQVMKKWKVKYPDKSIVDMFRINRNRNQLPNGITSLEKIIAISEEMPN